MKYKSYEDSAVQNTTGLNLELLDCKDEVSARNTNRPIVNLYENQETNYNLIQTLLKSVYGNSQGIIPDVYEDFAPEDFAVGSFKNDTSNYYIRIPTGMFLGRKVTDNQYIHNTVDGNPFSKPGEYNYKDEIHKENFLQDNLKSYILENKPEINLYERELAKLIDLDLSDLTNDIKIGCDMIPYAYKIAILDPQTGLQMLDSSGSPKFVVDDSSNVLYLAREGQGNYNIVGSVSETEAVTTIEYENKPNHEDPSGINVYTVVDGNYTVVKAENGNYTNRIEDAIIITDTCGNKKYKTGYYIKTVRATSADDEIVYLPNKRENTSWKVCLPALNVGDADTNSYTITVKDRDDAVVEEVGFQVLGRASLEGINDKLYSCILSLSSKFTAERFSENKNSDIVNGVKIISASSNVICNDYKLTIKRNNEKIRDYLEGEFLEDIPATPSVEQKYYDNIFELTNAFLGYYSSYLVKIDSIYNYVNLETIIKVPNISNNTYHLYYDLNANLDNAIDLSYDKTGRFVLTLSELTSDNFIHLFDINLSDTSIAPNTIQITNIKSYLNTLDRRMIAPKRAELKSLLVEARSELSNYIHIKDALAEGASSREIEILDYHDESNNNQTRITSPVLRLVDVKDDIVKKDNEILTEKEADSWEDSGNGDTPSDFFEESTLIRDFNNEGESHYLYHADNTNKGIIIDKNKGIKIFNNDVENTDGSYSYSSFKPIEIVSKKGNINLFNYDNEEGRINIANLKDTDKNIVDIKGITRVRSSQDGQLVVRKIGDANVEANKANIFFAVGTSTSKDDEIAKDVKTNVNIGSVNYFTGKHYTSNTTDSNIVDNNRFICFGLSDTNESNNTNALILRNAKSGISKKVLTMFGDIVPSNRNNSFTIGHPLGSRTYNTNVDPVVGYNSNEKITDLNVDNSGNSTEYLGTEGRWKAAFIQNGYLGHLTLADTVSDINNNDARAGVLRLGNSNIYDVSSLYINCDKTSGATSRANYGTINFDNALQNTNTYSTENTIASAYEEDDNKKYLSLVLYRNLGTTPSTNTDTETESNACAALFTPKGTQIRKNLYVKRQLWVNQRSSDASTYDNSAFVVQGQSVLKGELVVGRDAATVDTTAVGQVSANKKDSEGDNTYKLYNWEYWNSSNKSFGEADGQNDGDGNNILFLFRLYGRSYFEGDVTIDADSRFTEDTNFNKKVTIYNNNYALYKYNEKNNTVCPPNDSRLVSDPIKNSYDVRESGTPKLPRHNLSLDVKSGLIKFGSDYVEENDHIDQSDLILYGSQRIRRRLEVGTTETTLFDDTSYHTRLWTDGIVETEDENGNEGYSDLSAVETPEFFVNGSSQFNGDVVFGNPLTEVTNDNKSYYHRLSNKKSDIIKESGYNIGSKVIFWGKDHPEIVKTGLTQGGEKTKDWKSDFDFHGKTWFDNTVRIGMDSEDIHKQDSSEIVGSTEEESGSLEIFGKDAPMALSVMGSTENIDSVTSVTKSGYVLLRGGNNRGALEASKATYAAIELNGTSEESLVTGNKLPASTKGDTGFLRLASSGTTTIKAQAGDSGYINQITLGNDGEAHEIYGSKKGLKLSVSKSGNNYINIEAKGKDISANYISGNKDSLLDNFTVSSKTTKLSSSDNHGLFITKASGTSSSDKTELKASSDVSLTLDATTGGTLKADNSSATLNNKTISLLAGSSTGITISEEDNSKNILLSSGTSNTSISLNDSNKITLTKKSGNTATGSVSVGDKSVELDANSTSKISLTDNQVTLKEGTATSLILASDSVTLKSGTGDTLAVNSSGFSTLKSSKKLTLTGNKASIILTTDTVTDGENSTEETYAALPSLVKIGGTGDNTECAHLKFNEKKLNIDNDTDFLGHEVTGISEITGETITGTTKVTAPTIEGTTKVTAPTIEGTTIVKGKTVEGTEYVKAPKFYLNGYEITIVS